MAGNPTPLDAPAVLSEYVPAAGNQTAPPLWPPTHPSIQPQAYSSYVAAVALSAGDIVALIMWGFGLFWLVVAIASVVVTWRRMRFQLGAPAVSSA